MWQSTASIGVAALVALALRSNGARMRYWVWFAASLKFLVPFSALVSIGSLMEWRQVSELVRQPLTPTLVDIGESLARPIASVPAAYWLPLYVPALLVSVWLGGALVGVIGWLRAWLWFRGLASVEFCEEPSLQASRTGQGQAEPKAPDNEFGTDTRRPDRRAGRRSPADEETARPGRGGATHRS